MSVRFVTVGVVLGVLSVAFVVLAQAVRADTLGAHSPQVKGFSCAMTRTGEYPRADPAAVGFDPVRLRAAMEYAELSNPQTMKVFRRGCLVAEGVRDPLFDRVPANNWGQTKTISALVAGLAVDRGLVELDAPIGRYLPARLGDAAHRVVTLRNLLQQSSGAQVNQVRGSNFYADQSKPREFFTMPIVHRPGTYFEYDQPGPSTVNYVVQRAIWRREPGLDFQDFAQRELFGKLGIPKSAYFWQRDRAGTSVGNSQLWLRPLEIGRLGELLRTGGVYDGKRVISEHYLRELRTGARSNCGYGFLTYLNSCRPGQIQVDISFPVRRHYPGVPWVASAPADMIYTAGIGIRTFVIPSLDLVVTRTGEQELDAAPSALRGDIEGAVPGRLGAAGTHEFFRLLMAAVTDMPANVRATIAYSGPYDRPAQAGFDATHFLYPLDAPAGTLLSVGPGAPQGCTPLRCEDEPNDGLRWIGDIPRTVPGIVGAQTRPRGH